MPTETEELQAKEFLQRAEIRTMKKDLLVLREADAVKERNKIAGLKSFEEEKVQQQKKLQDNLESIAVQEKAKVDEVLGRKEVEEKYAEKNLKQFGTEPERQQIFLLEERRLEFENKVDAIDKERDPALKLEKNRLLNEKTQAEARLRAIIEEEKKQESEESFIAQKARETSVSDERSALEKRRWEIEDAIKNVEKKRWAAEKEIEEIETKIRGANLSANDLATERNGLMMEVKKINDSLREIYSGIITRVEEERRGQAQEQVQQRQELSEARSYERARVQREQRKGLPGIDAQRGSEFLNTAPMAPRMREKMAKQMQSEEEQRQKFMQDVEQWAQKTDQPQIPVPKKQK